jgi:hypothetical protein
MATDSNGVVIGATPPGVPHLAIPCTLDYDGTAAVVEQDTSVEVVQSVAMCVGSRPGQRLLVPIYGVPDPTFGVLNRAAVAGACGRWEKRATVSVQVVPGGNERVVVEVLQ